MSTKCIKFEKKILNLLFLKYTIEQIMYNVCLLIISVRKFGCPCARDNQKSRRTTKNTDVVVRRTTINFHGQALKLDPIYLIPSTDNLKLGRTTRNCNLGVHGTTIYFFPNSNTAYNAVLFVCLH